MALPTSGPISLGDVYREYYKKFPSQGDNVDFAELFSSFNLIGQRAIHRFYGRETIIPFISDWEDPVGDKNESGTSTTLGNRDMTLRINDVDFPTQYTFSLNLTYNTSILAINSANPPETTTMTASSRIFWRYSTDGGESWEESGTMSNISVSSEPGQTQSNSDNGIFNRTFVPNGVLEIDFQINWNVLANDTSHVNGMCSISIDSASTQGNPIVIRIPVDDYPQTITYEAQSVYSLGHNQNGSWQITIDDIVGPIPEAKK